MLALGVPAGKLVRSCRGKFHSTPESTLFCPRADFCLSGGRIHSLVWSRTHSLDVVVKEREQREKVQTETNDTHLAPSTEGDARKGGRGHTGFRRSYL